MTLFQPLDLDQLEPERLDLLEQPVQLSLIADLAAECRFGGLDRRGEVLEDARNAVAEPPLHPDLVVRGGHWARMGARRVTRRHPRWVSA